MTQSQGFSRFGEVLQSPGYKQYLERQAQRIVQERNWTPAPPRPAPTVKGEPYPLNVLDERQPGILYDWESRSVIVIQPLPGVLMRRYLEKYWSIYAEATLQDMPTAAVQQYHAALAQGVGAYLHSKKNGTGKTHMLVSIFKELCALNRDAVLVDYSDMCDELRQDVERPRAEAFERYCECEVLLIDDFARGRPTAWTAERLCTIIDRRNRRSLLTYFSTNKAVDEAKEFFNRPFVQMGKGETILTEDGDRVFSRLHELVAWIDFNHYPDHRRQR